MTIFQKLTGMLETYKGREQLFNLAHKCINNHITNPVVSVKVYATGELIEKMLSNNVYKLSTELIDDTLPIFLREGDKVLNDRTYISLNLFKDFYDEYPGEEIRILNILLQSWIVRLRELVVETEQLLQETKATFTNIPSLHDIFSSIDLEDFIKLDRKSVEDYMFSKTDNKLIATQISYLYEVIREEPELVDMIFYKQDPVLESNRLPIMTRLNGTCVQLALMQSDLVLK